MKKTIAMMLILVLALSLAGAAVAQTQKTSKPFRLPRVLSRVQATVVPTEEPTVAPTEEPTAEPTEEPTAAPTEEPTAAPTEEPTAEPTEEPTAEPTEEPTAAPTEEPTVEPTAEPTAEPTEEPTAKPADEPLNIAAVVNIDHEGSALLVRKSADAQSERVAKLHKGDRVTILGYEGDWARILVDGSREGYVFADYLSTEPVVEATAEPAVEPAAPSYDFEREADGSLKLDEKGNPVAIVPEGMEIPVTYERDAEGNLILDENGNPIPKDTIPADAEYFDTIEDALDPNRTIDLYATWGEGELTDGTEATMIAVLNGYDNVEYALQWQTSEDNVNWTDVPGATDSRCTVVVTQDNYLDYWRVMVTVTDVR